MRAWVLAMFLLAGCSTSDPVGRPGVEHCAKPFATACTDSFRRGESCACETNEQCESSRCTLGGRGCTLICEPLRAEVPLGERCDCHDNCGGLRCGETCPSGAYCKDVGLESRCAPLEGAGAPCTDGHPTCKPPLICAAKNGEGKCAATVILGEGASCGSDPPAISRCAAGLYCRNTSPIRGACTKQSPSGGPCENEEACAEPFSVCADCASGRCCTPKLGAACGPTIGCVASGLFCRATDHTCQQVHAVGAACDPAEGTGNCPSDGLTHFSSHCDPATKTCVGGACG